MVRSFKMNVYHNGIFLLEPLRYENGGMISISTPKLSYTDFVHLIENETSNTLTGIFYLVDGSTFENMLKIGSEEDIEIFFDIMESYETVNVYVDHHSVDLSEILHVNDGEGQFQGQGKGTSNIEHTVSFQPQSTSASPHAHTHTSTHIYVVDNDIPGHTFKPNDEAFIEYVVRLIDGKETYPNRVAKTDLFDKHPAVAIRNHHDLHPYMRDTRDYHLFYSKLPDDTSRDKFGYQQIRDRVEGVWEATGDSSIIYCDLSNNTTQKGEVQQYRYKPPQQSTTSTWRMVMYGLLDPQLNMVICKVFEIADSETVKAIKNVINAERDLEESLNTAAAEANKIELLVAALKEMRNKHYRSRFDIRGKTRVLAKKVRKYNRVQHKEADDIEPTNRERKKTDADIDVRNERRKKRQSAERKRRTEADIDVQNERRKKRQAERVAKMYLNIRGKTPAQRASISSSTQVETVNQVETINASNSYGQT